LRQNCSPNFQEKTRRGKRKNGAVVESDFTHGTTLWRATLSPLLVTRARSSCASVASTKPEVLAIGGGPSCGHSHSRLQNPKYFYYLDHNDKNYRSANTRFPGPPRDHHASGISIGPSVSAGLMTAHTQTDHAAGAPIAIRPNVTSYRPGDGETICPPPVRLAADLRPSADGYAVRTWLSCRQPACL